MFTVIIPMAMEMSPDPEALLLALLTLSKSGVYTFSGFVETNEQMREKRDANNWVVTTIISKPYYSQAEDGSGQYEGFIVDMMKIIGDKLSQKYSIHITADGKYGSHDATSGEWNGMIGEVYSGRADVAAAPITVSEARREAVDFTVPFMTFPTVILIHKSTPESSTPRTITDLLDQPDIRYGVVGSGATEQLIRSSTDPALERLKVRLMSMSSITDGIAKVRASKDGKFGFIMEESTAEFWRKQAPCDLTQVTVTQVTTREYAFALRKGSPDVARISGAIELMKKNGELDKLREKWWSGSCSGAQLPTPHTLTLALTAALMGIMRSGWF